MDKTDFLVDLQKGLKKYGVKNSDDYLDYYSEYLDDLIEHGQTPIEAINSVGGVQKVLLKILADENVQVSRLSNRFKGAWVLLTLGLPVWGAIIAAIYIIALAVVFIFFICSLAFIVSGSWTFLGSFIAAFKIPFIYVAFQLGMSLVLLGLGVICEQLFAASSNGLFKSSKYIFKKFNTQGI